MALRSILNEEIKVYTARIAACREELAALEKELDRKLNSLLLATGKPFKLGSKKGTKRGKYGHGIGSSG
jgi:hypothetical protein